MNDQVKGLDECYCSSCGQIIKSAAEICPKCGVRRKPIGGRTKVVAALLAIFLGGFGIHKFYLGMTGMGIVYLLFFWTIIPAIVAFFEGVYYLILSDDDFNAKYN